MPDAQLTANEVRRLAVSDAVRPHPIYHARRHHVTWEDCVYALANCTRVSADHRPQHAGTESYVAFGLISRSQVLRVDFQLHRNPDGTAILVVTAIPY